MTAGKNPLSSAYWEVHERNALARKLAERKSLDAPKLADEIMARIERDGAIHRDSLIEVIRMVGGLGADAQPISRGPASADEKTLNRTGWSRCNPYVIARERLDESGYRVLIPASGVHPDHIAREAIKCAGDEPRQQCRLEIAGKGAVPTMICVGAWDSDVHVLASLIERTLRDNAGA